MRRLRLSILLPCALLLAMVVCGSGRPARAQGYHFTLRAEPSVIPANGISTTSIFVQIPQSDGAISSAPLVHFATTLGVIESSAQLSGGVARVMLRSSTTAGTAVITAFVGASREAVEVEFSNDAGVPERYLEIASPYVAYGTTQGVVTSSGKTVLDFGDTHIESDTRLDVDLYSEHLWAQGNVLIRHGHGDKSHELHGDRLFYDLRRRQGVLRRADTSQGLARQEFVGSQFLAPPPVEISNASAAAKPVPPLTLLPAKTTVVSNPDAAPAPNQTASEASTTVAPPAAVSAPGIEPATPAATVAAATTTTATATTDAATAAPATSATAVSPAQADTRPSPDAPAAGDPNGEETRSAALVANPRPPLDGATGEAPRNPPPFIPMGRDSGPTPRIVELPPPSLSVTTGYWVSARRMRVFPRDKIQFERAAIFFNGGKVYRAPLYVLALDGSFNPTTDTLKINSSGGPTLKFPIYYQASDRGTGTLILHNEPGSGFSSQNSGPSLELNQQYWMSPRSHGSVDVDQIGNGAFNVNLRHVMQFSPTLAGNLFVTSPNHRDLYAQSSLTKDLKQMSIGMETSFDRPVGQPDNMRGQFFARMRPKTVGHAGWSYTTSANLLAVRRVFSQVTTTTGGIGGGLGIPGQGDAVTTVQTISRPLIGQTLTAALQSPSYSPFRGSTLSANIFTTAFNYSDGRRGVAPGLTMGMSQSFGRDLSARLDYTYDRSAIGLYGSTSQSFTHYVSGAVSAALSPKIGFNAFVSKSLQDQSVYGSADLSFRLTSKWRTGFYADYSGFAGASSPVTYGWSLGRSVGAREITLNYDTLRDKIYFELGGGRF